jgi:hypothetical protein
MTSNGKVEAAPEGRFVVGRFGGVTPVTRKDGTAVSSFFQVVVLEARGETDREHRLSYFETNEFDERTRMARDLDELGLQPEDRIRVRFVSRGRAGQVAGKAYVNDTAVSVERQ